MNIKYSSFSIPGPKGKSQDAFMCPMRVENEWWIAIADGVGGSVGGDVAALTCIQCVQDLAAPELKMTSLFSAVWDRLKAKASEHPELLKMSSTLTVLRLRSGEGVVGHVGDTRITHCRGSGVMARTKDQTEVQKLLDEGALSFHQAKRYPRRNVLLSAMSPAKPYSLFENRFGLLDGDRIILSTDGAHSKVTRREMVAFSEAHRQVDEFSAALEGGIKSRGIDDDATCVVVDITAL